MSRLLTSYGMVLLSFVALPIAFGQGSISSEQKRHLAEAKELDAKAEQLFRQGRLAEGIDASKQSLRSVKAAYGENHPETAKALFKVGFLAKIQGNGAVAQSYLEDALKIQRAHFGKEHDATANTLNFLGLALSMQGKYSEAEKVHREALDIRKNILGMTHAGTEQSLSNLAMVRQQLGDYDAARSFFEQALTIQRKNRGAEHPITAASLHNLGSLLKDQGDYAEAKRYYLQALEIRQKVLGARHVETATSFNGLGVLMLAQGDYDAAQDYLEKCLAIYRSAGEGNLAKLSMALNNLGGLKQAQRDFEAARRYFEESLGIQKKLHGDEHPLTAVMLNNIGLLLSDQGKLDEARSYLEQALEIRQKKLGSSHPETAKALNNLGNLLLENDSPADARKYLDQALEIMNKVYGEEHPETVNTLVNLARLQQAEGDWPAAKVSFDSARKGTTQFMGKVLPTMTPQEQNEFLASSRPAFLTALSYGYANRNQPAAIKSSAEWLINGKGRASDELAAGELLDRDTTNPKASELIGQLKDLRQKLGTIAMSVPRPDQVEQRNALLKQTEVEMRGLRQEITKVVGGSIELPNWVELDEVRLGIPSGRTMVNIARVPIYRFQATRNERHWDPPHYLAWLIPSKNEGDVELIDLGTAEAIDQQIESVRRQLSKDGEKNGAIASEGEIEATRQLTKELEKLAELMWKPISDRLSPNTDGLIISPDGAMWLLPWSVLSVDKDRYLIEDFALQYVISGRELVQTAGKTSDRSPLVFADPSFDLTATSKRDAVEAVFREQVLDLNTPRGLVSQTKIGKVSSLPNTRAEAAAISPSINTIAGRKPVSYLGEYALETVVKRISRPQMLVLSTHGFFFPDQEIASGSETTFPTGSQQGIDLLTKDRKPVENPLLRCGLLFAGCNQTAIGGDDGILTGMEILGLDLRGTQLVVLSACETGLGDIQTGEGVAGLRQAFQLAGAEDIVSTLWSVPDRDSAILISSFFENMADGQERSKALRQAQLKRIESRRQRYGAAHPYFWAAWTITGK